MSRRISRRQFIANTGLAGAGFWISGRSDGWASRSPNAKLNIACIGVGGKGDSDTNACGGENVVALCDVDENTVNKKAAKFPMAKKYSDYRKMLDEMGKEIDAVTVSTPDHMHAPAAIHAMSLGKHAFVQKPLSHTVAEARLMAKLARDKKLATQMGNQGTSNDKLREGADLVRAGGLGKVKEIYVWTNRPVWAQAPGIKARPSWTDPVPPTLNWDSWIGPAPMRPFAAEKGGKEGFKGYHPFQWRGWWDYGTGALGDMACHTMNLPNMAMKLGTPIAVDAESDPLNPETYPGWARVVYEFPQRGELPPIKLIWHEGRKDGKLVQPALELFQGEKISGSGSLIVGDKLTMYSMDDYGGSWTLLPKGSPAPAFERKIPKSPGHAEEWIRACKGGEPAMSNFDYAGPLTEMILIGNVSMKAVKRIQYDGETGKVTNDAKANGFLTKEYRKGWELKA